MIGTHDGRPMYIERNKEHGGAYTHVIPAEISYCQEMEAWVFRHDNIRTSFADDNEVSTPHFVSPSAREVHISPTTLWLQNPCSWLLKTQTTDSYDIIQVAKESQWHVWKGLIESTQSVSFECIECADRADCNYHGQCHDGECICNKGYFGSLCQFSSPCNSMRCECSTDAEYWCVCDLYSTAYAFYFTKQCTPKPKKITALLSNYSQVM